MTLNRFIWFNGYARKRNQATLLVPSQRQS